MSHLDTTYFGFYRSERLILLFVNQSIPPILYVNSLRLELSLGNLWICRGFSVAYWLALSSHLPALVNLILAFSTLFVASFFTYKLLLHRTNLMKLRSDYKDAFVEKHGVKLGLMSGFIKVCIH